MEKIVFGPKIGDKVSVIIDVSGKDYMGRYTAWQRLDGVISRLDPADEFENVEIEVCTDPSGNPHEAQCCHRYWFHVDDVVPFYEVNTL